MRIAFAFEFG